MFEKMCTHQMFVFIITNHTMTSGRDLGFKSSLFNLVFANNEASVRLWRKLGYTELTCLPKVAQLNGSPDLVDAYQFHYDFSQQP